MGISIAFRLRDKYDELARIFKGYAETTRFSETLFNGILNYSKSCTFLADVKDMEVQRLQSKVKLISYIQQSHAILNKKLNFHRFQDTARFGKL